MAEGKVVNPLVSKRLDEATTMVETLRIYVQLLPSLNTNPSC